VNHSYIAQLTKSSSSSEHDGTFVLNEESPDRAEDIIEVAGWDLAGFKRNPIALWQHDADRPVGYWKNLRTVGKQLIGDLKLASTRLGQMAKQLIEDNVLRAVSVGFRPLEYVPIEGTNGYRIKSAELLEVSLVSVPAHPNALRISKQLGLSQSERDLIFTGASKPLEKLAMSGTVQHALSTRESVRKLLEPRS
jgi:HK97 family phage prohead protease